MKYIGTLPTLVDDDGNNVPWSISNPAFLTFARRFLIGAETLEHVSDPTAQEVSQRLSNVLDTTLLRTRIRLVLIFQAYSVGTSGTSSSQDKLLAAKILSGKVDYVTFADALVCCVPSLRSAVDAGNVITDQMLLTAIVAAWPLLLAIYP